MTNEYMSPDSKALLPATAAAVAGAALLLRYMKNRSECPTLREAIPWKDLSPEVALALSAAARDHAMVQGPYDGCLAALTPAYHFSETIFIYPITPTTPLGETANEWAVDEIPNLWGLVPRVQQMQSETGAAAGVHGTLVTGGLSTTFTASQGLLLMIPNLLKIAGELLPCVIHVAARALAGQALSIFGDHSDIMAVRFTGMVLLSSHSVQESLDLALVAQIATFLCQVPFIHFFDGMRTSHEIQKITAFTKEHMAAVAKLLEEKFDQFRARALNPTHPSVRGTAQSPDIFFQNQEAVNPFIAAVPDAVRTAMQWVKVLTGRSYDLFQYYGHPQATDVVIIMGSGSQVMEELIDHYGPDKKVGIVKIHLFRPWSTAHFLSQIPRTCKRLAVLDRCKEMGVGEPLFTDVCASLQGISTIPVIGGRYGLGSKDFTTGMGHAIFENLKAKAPKHPFTVGIIDDVSNLSLTAPHMNTVPKGTVQCLFWGFGSDGTVGANKSAIKLISKNSDFYTQGYFAYDALKAGGVTCSNLRFGPQVLKSCYEIDAGCTYVAVHKKEYLRSFTPDCLLDPVADGAIFVLNSPWISLEDLKANVPLAFREELVRKKLQVYNIDAARVARLSGMGKLINNIMQTVFFQLSQVMDSEKAIAMFRQSVENTYKHKGPEMVAKNQSAIDMALSHLQKITLPTDFAAPLPGEAKKAIRARDGQEPAEVEDVLDPIQLRKGGSLPVSKFQAGGQVKTGMTQWAKRAVAASIPVVDMDKCTQCNKCAVICPHAVIRPFLAAPVEMKQAPGYFDTRKATGGNAVAGLSYRIQVSPMDCTGCEVCVNQCPDDALAMKPIEEELQAGAEDGWNFAMKLPNRGDRFDKFTAKGSQFQQPLMEFSGACEGCGETPYAKLLTQLFGKRMIIANATGCSSIWGGPAGWIPYTTDIETGHGPAWGNSLFEDNAEYGVGMVLSITQRRKNLEQFVEKAVADKHGGALQNALEQWLERKNSPAMSKVFGDEIVELLDARGVLTGNLKEIGRLRDLLMRPSMWMMGGDGWANDIGFGGIDHAVALGENINILILDTEVYSNTGGQSSKATPLGAVAKFANKGRRLHKKDLGGLLMTYPGVYVASCAMGASQPQCVKALLEAEAHDGPSVVICYSPCIEHRTKTGLSNMSQDQKNAVECGYWPLYRHDPNRIALGEPPFQLDFKTVTGNVQNFLLHQNRYAQLQRSFPEDATALRAELEIYLKNRHQALQQKANFKPSVDISYTPEGHDVSSGHTLRRYSFSSTEELHGHQHGPELLVAYGSDTGTAETVARRFAKTVKARGCSLRAVTELNEIDLAEPAKIVLFCSTCGDGDIPENAKLFYENAKGATGSSFQAHTFAVFALGDRGYAKFCEAGKLLDAKLASGGAQRKLEMGIGDACDEDGWETGYNAWLPTAFEAFGVPAVTRDGPPEPPFTVKAHSGALRPRQLKPPGSVLAAVTENRRMTPKDYERDIRHFMLQNTDVDLPFHLGDAVALYPQNLPKDVDAALAWFGYDGDQPLTLDSQDDTLSARLQALTEQRTTARQLLAEVLDICGKPTRSFYTGLAEFAAKEEASALRSVATGPRFTELAEDCVTVMDVFRMYPSAKPSLAHLLGLVPAMRYRLYSIANSSDYTPGCVELTIVVNQWPNKAKVLKTGTSTKYVANLKLGSRVAVAMTHGTFTFPKDERTPMVMAGLGTGIAPIRSFVQDRMYKKQQGIEVGPMVVFYGCRHEREEFLYKEEWEQYQKAGVLTKIVPAFSHDKPHYPPRMIFVNDKMEENTKLLGDLIGAQKGYFYMCGLALALPGIEKALKTAAVGAKIAKSDTVDTWLTEMKASGRYSQESY